MPKALQVLRRLSSGLMSGSSENSSKAGSSTSSGGSSKDEPVIRKFADSKTWCEPLPPSTRSGDDGDLATENARLRAQINDMMCERLSEADFQLEEYAEIAATLAAAEAQLAANAELKRRLRESEARETTLRGRCEELKSQRQSLQRELSELRSRGGGQVSDKIR